MALLLDVEKIDVEILIIEVEKRPTLWDITSEEYKDKRKKDKAWTDVCCALFDNFQQQSDAERKSVGQKIIIKWRNLRDYYRKCVKKEIKSGSGAAKKFKYIHADQLGFLSKTLQEIATCGSLEEEPAESIDGVPIDEENTSGPSTEVPTPNHSKPHRAGSQNKKHQDLEELLVGFLTRPISPPPPLLDEDQSFLNSLLPTLRSFDTDQKLEFRAEVLSTMRRIRKWTSNRRPHNLTFSNQTQPYQSSKSLKYRKSRTSQRNANSYYTTQPTSLLEPKTESQTIGVPSIAIAPPHSTLSSDYSESSEYSYDEAPY